jgi:hypothetical protein
VRSEQGIPVVDDGASGTSGQLLQSGFEWERQVIMERLVGRARVADGENDTEVYERAHDVAATLDALRNLQDGESLYQASLTTPRSLYERYGLDSSLVAFSVCRPDLVECRRNGGSRYIYRAVDLKASRDLKPSFRVQVSLYALQLQEVLASEGIDRDVDLEAGGIWLFGTESPEVFDLRPSLEAVERFLRERLTDILTQPLEQVDWHVWFRCEMCPWFSACRTEAERKRSVSLLPRLTVHGRRFLEEAAWDSGRSVETLDDLRRALEDPAQAIALNACGSLRGKADRLRNQILALESGEVIPHGGSTPAMPRCEHVRIVLSLESDPLSGRLYAAGISRIGGLEVFGASGCEEVFVAETPDQVPTIEAAFLKALYETLNILHDFNVDREWKEQRSLQVFVFDLYEQWILSELLVEAVKRPTTAVEATALLCHFQNVQAFAGDTHPANEKPFALVALTGIINETVALPSPFVTTRKNAAQVLRSPGCDFRYEPAEQFAYSLSNRLKADPILAAWETGDISQVEAIREETRQRLRAAHSIVDGLRHFLRGKLFAWPTKFAFPVAWNLQDPELSKLVFAVAYESLSNAIGTKARRALPWPERLRDEIAVPLISEGGRRWRLENPIVGENLGPDEFSRFLLAPAGEDGDLAQMGFNDIFYRDKFWGQKGLIRFAGIAEVHRDGTGMVIALDLCIKPSHDQPEFRRGDRAVLSERAVDFLSGRLIRRLQEIDEEAESPFISLIRNPRDDSKSRFTSLEAANFPSFNLPGPKLTASQKKAVRHFLRHELTLAWGAPGTGKTHCIAAAILTLAAGRIAAGEPLTVGITSLAHAGIENALLKVSQLIQRFGLQDQAGLYKLDSVHTARAEGLRTVPARKAAALEGKHPVLVIGATAFALEKAIRTGMQPLDVLVIDEASQVKLPEVALALMAKKPGGRLLAAGDDQQLPPIVGSDFPKPDNGDPWLLDSIFGFLRAKDSGAKPFTVQLVENFRMNATLTRFPAMTIYGECYQPATKRIAQRTLHLKSWRQRKLLSAEEQFADWALDPTWPLVLLVTEGVQAAQENPVEAEIVALLSETLRRRLLMGDTRRHYPDSAEGDRMFWNRGLFVVSPHHAQIRAIREALAKRREWKATPFVGTVEKMQGQEADCVIASYGVSDVETALFEGEFIFSRNRLNVSITRAKSKCVTCLPRPLLEPQIELLDDEEAAKGMAFMHNLHRFCQQNGEEESFALNFLGEVGTKKRLTAIRARYSKPQLK